MSLQPGDLPYFDMLLRKLDRGNPELDTAFGRHVHWGYWEDPRKADRSAEDFAAAAELLSQKVCDAASIQGGMKVLDVGCGFGGTIASLNERFSSMELVGLNIDARQLKRAREKVSPRSGNSIRFEEGDACRLPFENESFDAVLAVECIFHFSDRRRFFEEARRVLRPGGRIALSDFVPHPFLLPILRRSGSSKTTSGFFGHCNSSCTTSGYRSLAVETGLTLRVAEEVTAHTLPTFPFLRRFSARDLKKSLRRDLGIRAFEWISRTRLLCYKIFAFERVPPHAI